MNNIGIDKKQQHYINLAIRTTYFIFCLLIHLELNTVLYTYWLSGRARRENFWPRSWRTGRGQRKNLHRKFI